eukprot:1512832-Rhodomonas_salina.1
MSGPERACAGWTSTAPLSCTPMVRSKSRDQRREEVRFEEQQMMVAALKHTAISKAHLRQQNQSSILVLNAPGLQTSCATAILVP